MAQYIIDSPARWLLIVSYTLRSFTAIRKGCADPLQVRCCTEQKIVFFLLRMQPSIF